MYYNIVHGYLVLLFSFNSGAAQRRTLSDVEYYCGNKPADVVFLLDASNSIWGPDYQRQLDFVSDVIGMFEIAENSTRVGITAFSSQVYRQFYLNDFYNKDDMQRAIKRIRQNQGFSTNTGLALWHMRNKMFSEEHGARPGVSQIGIVLTDGQSQNMGRTVYEAFKAKSEKITLFAIGIGNQVNKRELIGIASEPALKFIFTVDGYSALTAIKNALAVRTCMVTRPTSTTTTTTTTTTATTTTTTPSTTTSMYDYAKRQCFAKRIDVVFAIDSSDNIYDADCIKQADFFKKLSESLDISTENTRVGSLLYSDQIQELFNVGDHESHEDVVNGLGKLGMTAGTSRVDLALRHILTKSFRRSFTRPETSQVGVIITGSPSQYLELSKHMSKKASKVGVQYIVIGVGDQVNEEELKIVANSYSKRIFRLQNFDELFRVIPEVAVQICEVPVPVVPVNDQPCGSKQEADIMFLMDSVNAGKRNTRTALEFIKSLIYELDIENENIHVGLVSAECEQDIRGFKLGAYGNNKDMEHAFDSMKGTDFHKIIHNMRKTAFKSDTGARKHAKKIAFFIIDGSLEQPLKTLTEAHRAKMHGVEVFAVQVGNEDAQDELLMIRDEPSSQHFYKVKKYTELSDLKTRILQSLCDEL